MRSKFSSKHLAIVLLVLSVTVFGIISVNAEHDTVTKIVSSGDSTITIRDITNTANATQSITLDGTFSPGNTITISVTDTEANLNSTKIETITTTSNSTTSNPSTAISILTESGANTGFYTGTLVLSSSTTTGNTLQVKSGDDLTVDYDAESLGVSRFSGTFSGLTGSSSVTLGDFIVDTNTKFLDLCPITPVTHPIVMTVTGEANLKPVTVTMSYANALLTGVDPTLLKIAYRPDALTGTGFLVSTVDEVAKTVTATKTSIILSATQSGHYILGFDIGCPGGGGGGLVSPGLVVNALAGLVGAGAGAGGSPGASLNNLIGSRVIDVPEEIQQMVVNHDSYSTLLPMDPDSFEGFDFPLVINDQAFVLGGFANTLQTTTIKTDTPVTMTFTLYTTDKIQHFSLYTNLRGANDSIPKSDTQILYNDGKDLKIIDPNGFFSDAKITVTEEEEDSVKKYVTVEMTFAKEMDTSHIITRIWDSKLRSGDTHLLDAIKIIPEEPEFVPIPQETEEVQVEELKSQTIPKWVKSNAEWWVDQQIGDEDFVAGIQYMVNNGIMYIPNTEPVNSVTEIPDWIKTSTQWWVDNQISDDDFVQAMEWLVTNGVLRIE